MSKQGPVFRLDWPVHTNIDASFPQETSERAYTRLAYNARNEYYFSKHEHRIKMYSLDGTSLDFDDGPPDGLRDGASLGNKEGFTDGTSLGTKEGTSLGDWEYFIDGLTGIQVKWFWRER